MTLEIQKYLIGKDKTPLPDLFAQLEAEYGISAKQHSKYPNLWLFKYSQLDSNPALRIVQECRGIILDQSADWKVVAFPFTRFFNSHEPNAVKIDWESARVQEKLDGTLIILYWYDNKWNVATSGCPDGTNRVGDFADTFGDFFWRTFKNQGLDEADLCPTHTYMWELTSPFNRIVCDYKSSGVTLIGARSVISFREVPSGCIAESLPRVKEFPLGTLEGCLAAANHLDPLKNEGFVIVDKFFNRIKVKSLQWIALHHVTSSCSSSKLAEVVRAGEYEEFLIAIDSYPEIKEKFLLMVERYNCRIEVCTKGHERLSGIENQKDFAAEALKYDRNSSVLFAMRKRNKSAKAVVKDMTRNAYLGWLGVKE